MREERGPSSAKPEGKKPLFWNPRFPPFPFFDLDPTSLVHSPWSSPPFHFGYFRLDFGGAKHKAERRRGEEEEEGRGRRQRFGLVSVYSSS